MTEAPAIPATNVTVEIAHASHVGEARRHAREIAETLTLKDEDAGRLALVVTEAGTNIVKHADRGTILLRGMRHNGGRGVEVLAIDQGPGIANIGESLRDGASTAGTPGTGLGAMSRMSSEFDIYSRQGKGVAVRCAVWSGPVEAGVLQSGGVCVPKPGEAVSGDGWLVRRSRGGIIVMVVDGLGHGADAALAAEAATDVASRSAHQNVADLVDAMHGPLRSTRGAALAAALIKEASDVGEFCGVGNIACRTYVADKTRSLMSQNGILGHQMRKLQVFQFPFPTPSMLIMHSDGIGTRWNLDDYPALSSKHPALIAAVLYRDHRRGQDDATVVVTRSGAAS